MVIVPCRTNYTVSQKTRQFWNGVARNCKDRFWWYLAEIFQIGYRIVSVLQFSCRFACIINLSSFKPDTESNANFHAIPSTNASTLTRCYFLPRDATESAVMLREGLCPSVCLSVCDVQLPWSRRLEFLENNFTAALRPLLGLTPTWAIWCNGNTPKIGVE